jgi:hypothetical protein
MNTDKHGLNRSVFIRGSNNPVASAPQTFQTDVRLPAAQKLRGAGPIIAIRIFSN